MKDLEQLKKDVLAYCERKEANGSKVLGYDCPCCKAKLKTVVPDEVGEVWDTATTCYECGELHFVVKKTEGVEASTY